MGHHQGRVHEAEMVGSDDVASLGIELLQSFHPDPHAADEQQNSGPRPGDLVRLVAGRVKGGRRQRESPHDDGREDNQRIDDQKRSQVRHRQLFYEQRARFAHQE